MHRSPIEQLRARWVTGHRGHAFAFLLDASALVRPWLRWRREVARARHDA